MCELSSMKSFYTAFQNLATTLSTMQQTQQPKGFSVAAALWVMLTLVSIASMAVSQFSSRLTRSLKDSPSKIIVSQFRVCILRRTRKDLESDDVRHKISPFSLFLSSFFAAQRIMGYVRETKEHLSAAF